MSACKQPGCSGLIEEGYCNVCGIAAPRPTLPDGSRTSSPGSPGPSACTQPGCKGTIEDGYCNACGMAGRGSTRTGSARTGSTRSARSSRTGSGRTGRATSRAIGGLPIARPPLPPQDPLAAIIQPVVPERKRFCSSCDTKLKRESGFCSKCGQEYSFIPSLKAGDRVKEKYEIKGTIAFGGLGWIYLALDTVLSRWVILKGLLNSKDPRMVEVAVKEREFLAAVKHPNIVAIYDFITHGQEGFIVMEYVNGKTLMTLRKERGGPLPAAEAISYILEILPAFRYIDESGLVYCDFKPENAMVEEDTVKLIDLGAVRRADETGGDIYGSKGYTAPEAHEAPTAVSDLFSVARALAVLVANFDFQGAHEYTLPPAAEVEVFAKNEALYRFLQKATREKAEERFQTAEEMSEQLLGVLRHVVGAGEVGHVESAIFDPDSDGHHGIPRIKVDKDDAAANVILAAGAVPDAEKRLLMFQRALKQFPASLELELRVLDELVSLGRYGEAESQLARIQEKSPSDWRLAWYRGRWLLAQGKAKETIAAFQGILAELPGELAPKQALGRAYEDGGDLDRAIGYYDAVSSADATFTSAAFGLARCHEKKKERAAAAAAYRRVPPTSSRYGQAQVALARVLLDEDIGAVTKTELTQAADAVETLSGMIDNAELHRLRADLFRVAAGVMEDGITPSDERLAGIPLRPRELRRAAEHELRTCARLAPTDDERIRLVDRANEVRPRTFF